MSSNLRRKVLFINSNMEKNPWPVVPLGLCLVASNLKGHEKKFLDLTFKKSPKKAIVKTLTKFEPDFVCVGIRNIDNTNYESSYFYLQQIKSEIIDTIRNNSPAAIILGGAAININPAGIIRLSWRRLRDLW